MKNYPGIITQIRNEWGKHKGAFKSSWSRQGHQKSFTLTIPLNLVHCTSTPHHSETIGIAERAIRRVKEGTSAVLLQSGLDEKWCADSIECYCYLRNIQDFLSDGETPCERRFGVQFKGLVIPFGAMVEYHPISAKDLSRLHQFGPKVLPGFFLGYALHEEGIWKGDSLVADIEELDQMDASEIYAKRLNAKEVLTLMSGEKCKFPIADATIKISGGDQVLRTSTLIRDRPDKGEEQGNLRGESDGSSSTILQDSSLHDRETRNDIWSISGNLFAVITWNPESNCTCREKNHFLFH